MTFGDWPEDVHTTSEQQKRIQSAQKSATTPSSIDKESLTGIFPGSGKSPYKTSLESCTCVDFVRRKLPCKHMYRLAMECGAFSVAFQTGINKNAQITLADAVSEIENLPDSCQLFIEQLSSFEPITITVCEKYRDLESCCLLIATPLHPSEILETMRKKDIAELLQKQDYRPEKNLKKDDLIPWCIDHVPNLQSLLPRMVSFSFTEDAQKVRHKLHTYLLRKFDWDSYYDGNMNEIRYPRGAKFEDTTITIDLITGTSQSMGNPNICHFPDDEITRLLTLYGHNRCLNGYEATP